MSIFSDKADNVMSCYIDDKPWKTFDRTFGGFSPTSHYEAYITRQITSAAEDTLTISWLGRLEANNSDSFYEISIVLPVSKNFTYADFNNLQGKRLTLDTTNGFFMVSDPSLYNGIKGSGSIYFHFAKLDNISSNVYSGRMSGIFEADLGSIKIRSGRFDHSIDPEQVRF